MHGCRALVDHLRERGEDVLYMAEVAPSTSGADVMVRAQHEDRLLPTEDKDFGDLAFRHGAPVPGIVVLRLDPAQHALKRRRLDAAMVRFGEDGLRGPFTIVEERRFRSRPLRQGL